MAILKKIFRTRPHILLLYSEAFFEQLLAGAVIKTVPFRKIVSLYRNCDDKGRNEAKRGKSTVSVQEIKEAVALSSRISPWRNKCFTSSLAARKMLSRRGMVSELFLGINTDARGAARAHAWIVAGDEEIVANSGGYTPLHRF